MTGIILLLVSLSFGQVNKTRFFLIGQQLNNFRMERRCPLIGCCCFALFFIPGAICLLISLIFYSHFDVLLEETVRKQMIISNDTFWWYQHWLEMPVTETLSVNFFEVENLVDIQKNWSEEIFFNNNSKPIQNESQVFKMKKPIQINKNQFVKPRFREVGPFVFRIKRRKKEISFNNENKEKIAYLEQIQYHFDPLLSYENLHYKIVVVNSELSVRNLKRNNCLIMNLSNPSKIIFKFKFKFKVFKSIYPNCYATGFRFNKNNITHIAKSYRCND